MKYIAKPFVVEAQEITEKTHPGHPNQGDYIVTDSGETGVIAKAEFERKFVKATNSPHSAGY